MCLVLSFLLSFFVSLFCVFGHAYTQGFLLSAFVSLFRSFLLCVFVLLLLFVFLYVILSFYLSLFVLYLFLSLLSCVFICFVVSLHFMFVSFFHYCWNVGSYACITGSRKAGASRM